MTQFKNNATVRWLTRNPIWAFVVIIFIFFSLAAGHFFALENVENILVQTSTIGLIALGLTLVMINGNIDLSVGAILALSATIAVDLQGRQALAFLGDWSLAVAVPAALVCGILLAGLNGLVVWKTGVDSFIVTLGAMLGIRGVVFVYTREQSFYASSFTYSDFGSSSIGPLPTLAVLFIACAVVIHLLLTRTVHGRNTYAVGGNRDAAVNAGIRVGPHMVVNFMIGGFFAALAGLALSTQMGASTPNMGREYELWTITAIVLGGTKLKGGAGSIVGTLGGVLAIGILRNGMNLMQVPSFYVLVVLGVILVAVLALDKALVRKASRSPVL